MFMQSIECKIWNVSVRRRDEWKDFTNFFLSVKSREQSLEADKPMRSVCIRGFFLNCIVKRKGRENRVWLDWNMYRDECRGRERVKGMYTERKEELRGKKG